MFADHTRVGGWKPGGIVLLSTRVVSICNFSATPTQLVTAARMNCDAWFTLPAVAGVLHKKIQIH